jgi:hypothetical protein
LIDDLGSEPKLGMLLVYYAGHGAAINGHNSLLLSGFNPDDATADDYIGMDELLAKVADLHFSSYLFAFDACRTLFTVADTAPVISSSQSSSLRGLSMQSVDSNVLADVEYAISFSAGEDQVAQDRGPDGYSPYASAFSRLFRKSRTATEALLALRREVLAATEQMQNPMVLLRWGSDVSLEPSAASTVSVTFPDMVGRYILASGASLGDFHTSPIPELVASAPVPAVRVTFDAKQTAALAEEMFSERVGADFLVAWNRYRYGPGMNRSTLMRKITGRYPDEVIFDLNSTFEMDGTFLVDGAMDVTADIDSDGRPEHLSLSSYRGGATISFESKGQSYNADGMISPSADSVHVFDFSMDGVADYVIGYESWFAVLDGARLIELADHPMWPRNSATIERALSSRFKTTLASWCKDGGCTYRYPLLGPIADAVLFFDLGRLEGDIEEGAIPYRGSASWYAHYDPNAIVEKRARFNRQTLETNITSDWKTYGSVDVPAIWRMN